MDDDELKECEIDLSDDLQEAVKKAKRAGVKDRDIIDELRFVANELERYL